SLVILALEARRWLSQQEAPMHSARMRHCRAPSLGRERPRQRGFEAVVAPEQFIADDERRRAEYPARRRLLGLKLERLLGLGRVGRGKGGIGGDAERSENRAQRGVVADVFLLGVIRREHRAAEG